MGNLIMICLLGVLAVLLAAGTALVLVLMFDDLRDSDK